MKDKKLRMYLVFWSNDLKMNEFSSNAGFGKAKTGDLYLNIADTMITSKDYIDFESVEKEFLKKCDKEKDLIGELNQLNGYFNIEIVPSFTKNSIPAIIFSRDFFNFLNTIRDKLNIVELDMYVN